MAANEVLGRIPPKTIFLKDGTPGRDDGDGASSSDVSAAVFIVVIIGPDPRGLPSSSSDRVPIDIIEPTTA